MTAAVVWVENGRGRPATRDAAARSAQLVADARADADPGTAIQLAIAAYRASPTPAATDLLYSMLDVPPQRAIDTSGSGVLRVATQTGGNLAAAVHANGTLDIWDMADSSAPVRKSTIKAYPLGVALAPHAALLAGPCTTLALCLWNLSDPAHPVVASQLPRAGTEKGAVSSMAVSPDGTMLAAATLAGQTLLWSISHPEHPRVLADIENPSPNAAHELVGAVAFAPSGKLLATTIQDGETGVFDLTDPAHPTLSARITTGYQSVAFSPDGSLLAAAGGRQAGLWNMADPTHPAAVDINTACADDQGLDFAAVGFSPDGATLAYSGIDTTDKAAAMCLLNTATANLRSGFPTAVSIPTTFNTYALGYLSTGALLTGGQDGTLRIWRAPVPQIDETDTTHGVYWETWDVSSNGHEVAAPIANPGREPKAVGIWDISATSEPVLDGSIPAAAHAVNFLTDTVAMTITADGATRLWDLSDPKRPVRGASLGSAVIPTMPGWSFSIVVTQDTAADLVSVLGADGRLHLWKVKSASAAAEVGSIPATAAPRGPAGLLGDGHTALFETPTGIDWWNIADPAHPVHGGFSPMAGVNVGIGTGDTDLMAAGNAPDKSGGGFLDLVQVLDGTPKPAAAVTRDGVGGLALDEAAHLLATIDSKRNKTLTLWDIHDPGHPRSQATEPVPEATDVTFDGSGTRMADWNQGTVQIWDVHTPSAPALEASIGLPASAVSAGAMVSSVKFSRSGAMLYVDTGDAVFVYDADPAGLVTQLCSDIGHPISAAQWRDHAPGIPYQNPCP